MGIAAYNRGSESISRSIEQDFIARGGQRKRNIEQLTRMELNIQELEQFTLDALSLFAEVNDPYGNGGVVVGGMRQELNKRKGRGKLKRLLSVCTEAHCRWVDSNPADSINHLSVCRATAASMLALLDYLNPPPTYRYPFPTPRCL